jgi:very-short-patch-repair endonuclease
MVTVTPYRPELKQTARTLRQNMTDSELKLWSRLRGKQILGVQFYRQKPLGDYIVDFYAPKAKLVIEIDGSQHLQPENVEKDILRDAFLNRLGIKVLRFDSRTIFKETEGVLETIYITVKKHLKL